MTPCRCHGLVSRDPAGASRRHPASLAGSVDGPAAQWTPHPTHTGTVAGDRATPSSAVPTVSRAFSQRVAGGPETKYYGYPTPADSGSQGRERAAGTRPRERPHLPPAEGLALRPAWPTSSEEGPCAPRVPPASPTQRLWPQPSPCWGQAVGPETPAISVSHTFLLGCTLISFRTDWLYSVLARRLLGLCCVCRRGIDGPQRPLLQPRHGASAWPRSQEGAGLAPSGGTPANTAGPTPEPPGPLRPSLSVPPQAGRAQGHSPWSRLHGAPGRSR